MKKLLAVAPFAVLLGACATNAPTTTTAPTTNTQQVVQSFTCEDDGMVTAAYAADGQAAKLNVTLPKIGLNNADIEMKQAVSGSGARYIKESSSKASYEWQTKANVGVLSIRSVNDRKYSVTCRL